MTISALEETLFLHLRAAKLDTGMVREYRAFAMAVGGTGPGLRKRLADAGLKDWRIDFAFVAEKIAVEVEGGTWTGGRHVNGVGFDADCEKYNKLTLMGWKVLRFTGTAIKSGVALKTIEAALSIDWGTATWRATA
jgi:hypothetical protein